jgi:hypothetical protein
MIINNIWSSPRCGTRDTFFLHSYTRAHEFSFKSHIQDTEQLSHIRIKIITKLGVIIMSTLLFPLGYNSFTNMAIRCWEPMFKLLHRLTQCGKKFGLLEIRLKWKYSREDCCTVHCHKREYMQITASYQVAYVVSLKCIVKTHCMLSVRSMCRTNEIVTCYPCIDI